MSKTSEREADFWVTWPDWAKDAILVDTTITFSLGDRLRILIGRQPMLMTRTFTENVVGRAETLSSVLVPRVWPRRRGLGVTAEAGML